ncbi:hypothetical protein BJ742DRAFT_790706 [Cladochytrium replicatum]|nr:hypothetical protein BJ742DRAFT_790706 [Cladochytrium replicatum]
MNGEVTSTSQEGLDISPTTDFSQEHSKYVLLRVKGKRKCYVREVPLVLESLNHTDVFVLGHNNPTSAPALMPKSVMSSAERIAYAVDPPIFVFFGKDAGRVKCAKGKEIAHKMREREWARKASIMELDGGNRRVLDHRGFMHFWKILHTGSPCPSRTDGRSLGDLPPVPSSLRDFYDMLERPALADDAEWERTIESKIKLFRIDDGGRCTVATTGKSMTSKLLQTRRVFVLETGDEVYTWIGRGAKEDDIAVADKLADEILASHQDYDGKAVSREKESVESVLFTEQFTEWTGVPGGSKNGSSTSNILTVKQASNVEAKDKSRYVYDRGAWNAKKENKIDVMKMVDPPPPPASWNRPDVSSNEELEQWVDDGGPPPPRFDLGALQTRIWIVGGGQKGSVTNSNDSITGRHPALVELSGTQGTFYSGACYIVLYKHLTGRVGNEKEASEAYFWLGSDSKPNDQGTVAYAAVDMEKKYGARQVRMLQGKETIAFRSIFEDRLLLVRKGLPELAGITGSEEKIYSEHEARVMVVVRGWSKEAIQSYQVQMDNEHLCPAGCVVLKANNVTWVWNGAGSFSFEREAAEKIASRISNLEKEVISEGNEPPDFLESLNSLDDPSGAQKCFTPNEFIRSRRTRAEGSYKCRMFRISHVNLGNPTAEETEPFTQRDLQEDGVYFIDAYFQTFIWVGRKATHLHREIRVAIETALEYVELVKKKDQDRGEMPIDSWGILFVGQGTEPPEFRAAFLVWEGKWKSAEDAPNGGQVIQTVTAVSVLRKIKETKYTLVELKSMKPLPIGLDPSHLEDYITEDDFGRLLKLDREAFGKLPLWQQTSLKQKVGLF